MGVAELVEGIDSELADLRTKVTALESARNALVGDNGNAAVANPPAPQSRTGNGRKRGRPRGGGTRSDEAVKLVAQTPGISIPDMAKAMGIEANYLYRVLPKLANEQKVRRDGQGWFPVT